ncbi:hypothetical protein BGZ60DRAFT_535182 [Tricladium varicosporioides]|nr:hypothetical protein BGZ60DRAFT_535182 [Hymenoscyphus varicosporioides]
MVQTLLLTFIHGFKGDEETFFGFPSELKAALEPCFPDIKIQTAVYPKYETRGDLGACVETFREWLQDQVTVLEKQNGNKKAIVEPSVGIVVVGHSMGGFVAADTVFSILENRPNIHDAEGRRAMFPLVLGLLTFDTPYNGLARSLFAYGAFSQYQNVSNLYSIFSTLTGSLGISAAQGVAARSVASQSASGVVAASATSRAGPASWKRWQILAARTGTIGAIVAGGVGAYVHREAIGNQLSKISLPSRESLPTMPTSLPTLPKSMPAMPGLPSRETVEKGLGYVGVNRDSIGGGFAWLSSHLKFVGSLMKQAQMTTRLERLESLGGIGLVNIYASLGENGIWTGGYFVPKRTFCAVPMSKVNNTTKGEKEPENGMEPRERGWWIECPNSMAENEVAAHCSMFQRDKNENYELLLNLAKESIQNWVKGERKEVVDDFIVEEHSMERRQSIVLDAVLDDDGLVKESAEKEKQEEVTAEVKVPKEESEDEKQLRLILESQDLPEPEDGGVSNEQLNRALEIPLPEDEGIEPSKEIVEGLEQMSLPAQNTQTRESENTEAPVKKSWVPSMPKMPSISMPSIPAIPSIPSIPTIPYVYKGSKTPQADNS